MEIIYLSRNMENYSAIIQQDVMDELARIADVYFYGPGFPNYNINDDIYEIIAKSSFKPDIIALSATEDLWLPGIALLKRVKDKGILTIAGGVFSAFSP